MQLCVYYQWTDENLWYRLMEMCALSVLSCTALAYVVTFVMLEALIEGRKRGRGSAG